MRGAEMRKDLIIKTKSLAGASDLTLLASIKPGLVPALDSATYKTRVKRVLATLSAARSVSHEYALVRPFSDAVERVGRIHSVRVAVVEPQPNPPSGTTAEDKVLLAATFDGTWESYIRVLWQKVGSLLDVIFCNTVDYVTAVDHTFEEWDRWARRVQIETQFFYSTPGLTVDDVSYLRKHEAQQIQFPPTPDEDLGATRQVGQSVETIAWNVVTPPSPPTTLLEAGRQGLQALSVLYRLTDLYVPGEADGRCLHRAARD